MDTNERIKRRVPVLAGVLSLMVPGLGHIYAGKLIKGLLLVLVSYIVIAIASLLLISAVPHYVYGSLLCLVLLYSYVIISAFMLARRNKEYKLKKFNHWFVYITVYTTVYLLDIVFHELY